MVRINRLSVIAVVLGMFLAGAARGQALEQVPADALVVIKIGNLAETSQKLGNFVQQWNLAQIFPPAGMFADPLSAFQMSTNMQQGLRKDGDLVFAFCDPNGADEEQGILLLVPVTDYQAFIGNFQPAKDGDLDTIKFGGGSRPSYVAQRGAYAAISPAKEALAKKPGGLQMVGQAGKLMAGKGADLMLWANGKSLGVKAMPAFKEARPQIMAELDQELKNNLPDPKYAPVLTALVNQGLNAVEQTLTDAQAGTFSVTITPDGFRFSLMGEFEPNSYVGKIMASAMNGEGTMVKGLPEADYTVIGGMVQNPEALMKVFNDFVDPISKELAKLDNGALFQDAVNAFKTQCQVTTGQSFGVILAPPAGEGQGMLKVVSMSTGDAKALIAAQKKAQASSEAMMKAFPGPQGKLTMTDNAKTIEGVSFDQISVEYKVDPNKPEDAMAGQVLGMIFGGTSATTYIGAVDNQHVLGVMGDDALLQSAVKAAKAGAAPKVEGIQLVDANLPKKRVAAFYFAVDKAANFGITMAGQMGGANININFPATPPIGMAVSTEGSAIMVDMFIPGDLIKNAINVGMQFQAQMMRPRGGAPGAGRPGDL